MIPEIVIEGKNIQDIHTFYQEINRVFMQNETWKLAESLDAFNDLLYGGYGILNGMKSARLIWNDMEESCVVLGYESTKS
jgi:RNAse (barnase) inhibitor barstar